MNSKPTVRHLRASSLSVDPSVQRAQDSTRVRAIARNLDRAALGVLTVSERDDGTYHIIDGQTRHAAVLVAGTGDEMLACNTYRGLTIEDEAHLFRYLNNTKAVHSLDRFRVRVMEREPVAVLLDKTVRNQGWVVQAGGRDGQFTAVSALERVYQGYRIAAAGQIEVCQEVLAILTEAYGHVREAMRGELVSGLGKLLLRDGGRVDADKLVSELGRFSGGASGLLGKARGLKDLRGGSLPDNVAEVLVGLHNRKRRTRLLDRWDLAT